MSKRIRIYTTEDVAAHTQPSSCWVSRAGKVYDVSGFLNDHPGGDDLILAHAGKDIEDVMKDRIEHEHSESAYSMLDGYVIGRLGTKESIVRDGSWHSALLLSYDFKTLFWCRLGGSGRLPSRYDRLGAGLREERLFGS